MTSDSLIASVSLYPAFDIRNDLLALFLVLVIIDAIVLGLVIRSALHP
jgi:hypothetical protein